MAEKIIEIQSFGYEILKISEYKTLYFLIPKFKNIEEFSRILYNIGNIFLNRRIYGTIY